MSVNTESPAVALAPGVPPVPLPGARLYLLDDTGEIKVEQVVLLIPD